jgi:hypothetical protein
MAADATIWLQDAKITAEAVKDPTERVKALAHVAVQMAAAGWRDQARAVFADARHAAQHIENLNTRALSLHAAAQYAEDAKMMRMAQLMLSDAAHAVKAAQSGPMVAIARMQTRIGDIQNALKTAGFITDDTDRDYVIMGMVDTLVAQGQIDHAIAISHMAKGFIPRQRVLRQLAIETAYSGDTQGGVALAQAMRNPDYRLETQNILQRTWQKRTEFFAGKTYPVIYRWLSSRKKIAFMLTKAGDALENSNEVAAMAALQEALKQARICAAPWQEKIAFYCAPNETPGQSTALRLMASQMAQAGNPLHSRLFLRAATGKDWVSRHYIDIAMMMQDAGFTQQARAVLAEGVSASKLWLAQMRDESVHTVWVNPSEETADGLISLALAYGSIGDTAQMLATLHDAQKIAQEWNVPWYDAGQRLAEISAIQAEVLPATDALKTAEDISYSPWRVRAILQLAHHQLTSQ